MSNTLISNINIYRCTSKRNYEKHEIIVNKIEELIKLPNSFLLGSDYDEIFAEYVNQKNCHLYSCVVFQAMALEAFLNEYIYIRLGPKYAEYIDKLSPEEKLIVGCKMITGKEFPKGNKSFEIFKNTFKHRNNLVHFKAKIIDIGTVDDIGKLYHTDCDLKEIVSAYDKIVEEIKLLDDTFDKSYLEPIPDDFWNVKY